MQENKKKGSTIFLIVLLTLALLVGRGSNSDVQYRAADLSELGSTCTEVMEESDETTEDEDTDSSRVAAAVVLIILIIIICVCLSGSSESEEGVIGEM